MTDVRDSPKPAKSSKSVTTSRSVASRLKPRLGWREWVGLPGLGVPAIKAKLDTGARTSAIHAVDVVHSERDGIPWVTFSLLPFQRTKSGRLRVDAEVIDRRVIRSSSGATSTRFTIVTPLECAGGCWDIELTLASRDQMGFRMLLGRSALRGFLIDPSASWLTGIPALPVSAAPRRKR